MHSSFKLYWASLIFIGIQNVASAGPRVVVMRVAPTRFLERGVVSQAASIDTQSKQFSATFARRAKTAGAEVQEIGLVGNEAARSKIISELNSKLESLSKGDIFVFYLGCHGRHLRQGISDSPTYYCLQNGEIANGTVDYNNLITLNEIIAVQSSFPHVYFFGFVDACYSGFYRGSDELDFYSKHLGARGFFLCSSTSNAQSYWNGNKSFTGSLTEIYGDDIRFKLLTNPRNLQIEVNKTDLPSGQVSMLIPNGSELDIIFPLPSLCFFALDFGKELDMDASISWSISRGVRAGSTIAKKGQGFKALSLPAVDNVKITVQINDKTILREENFNLKGKGYRYALLKEDGTTDVLVDASSTYKEYEKLIATATEAKLSSEEIVDIGSYALAIRAQILSKNSLLPLMDVDFLQPAAKLLAEKSKGTANENAIRIWTGIEKDVPITNQGLMSLIDAGKIVEKVGWAFPSASIASNYVKQIEENFKINKIAPEESWISINKLMENSLRVSDFAKIEQDQKTLVNLQKIITEDPKTNPVILSPDNRDKIIKNINSIQLESPKMNAQIWENPDNNKLKFLDGNKIERRNG